jgi:hypothetical protein
MFEKFKEKIENLSIQYLFIMALFLGLGIATDVIILIYDTLLLGIVLGNGIEIKETLLAALSLVICTVFFVWICRRISKKRK